jgi:hypothetical protein
VNRTFCILATVAAMGLGTVSAAAASHVKSAKHAVQKKAHVVHHAKAGAKTVHTAKSLHTSKPAASHKTVKPAAKTAKTLSHKTASKSNAKTLSRLEKRRA